MNQPAPVVLGTPPGGRRDPLADLDAHASTPDGRVGVRIRGRSSLTVTLAPGYYDQVTETELSRQLTQLARLAFVQRTRAYYELRSRAFGRTVTRESSSYGARDLSFTAGRASIVASGSSPDGRIRVTAAGMESWTVDLEPGTLAAYDEAGFCAAVAAAGHDLVEDQFRQIRRLKDEIYG